MTINDELRAMRERVEAATEGPWEEKWLPIPGFDGYEISDFGNVRSYYLKGNHIQKRSPHPRLMKTVAKRDGGYQTVALKDPDGKYRHKMVHRLVMLAFVGTCPDDMEVAHLNGDHSDARLANLVYLTHRENEAHKREHGTHGAGERNSNAKLQGWQVEEIKFLASKSIPQGKIAALFDMSHRDVSAILRGKAWRDTHARTDLPRLLDAVERVVGLHRPMGAEDEMFCAECGDYDPRTPAGAMEYPCATLRVITEAVDS